MADMKHPDNHSDFLRSVRFLARSQGLPVHLVENTRNLRPEEIRHLERRGNLCADWDRIRVRHDFQYTRVLGNHFIGACTLGTFRTSGPLPAGIYHSTVRDSAIGEDAVVYRCPLIEDTILDRNVTMIGSRSSAACEHQEEFAGCRFSSAAANGISISVQPEQSRSDSDPRAMRPRAIRLYADISSAEIQELLRGDDHHGDQFRHAVNAQNEENIDAYRDAADLPWCYLGPETVLDNGRVRGSWIGAGSRIEDNGEVVGSTLVSSIEDPITVRRGGIVEDSILQRGTRVSNYASVRRSILLPGADCRYYTVVSESVIECDTVLSNVRFEHRLVRDRTANQERSDPV